MDRICRRMLANGVEFVSLEEAMRDPFNAIAPPVIERRFRNVTQKWCGITGTSLETVTPRMMDDLASILPMPGLDVITVFDNCFRALASGMDAQPRVSDFLE